MATSATPMGAEPTDTLSASGSASQSHNKMPTVSKTCSAGSQSCSATKANSSAAVADIAVPLKFIESA